MTRILVLQHIWDDPEGYIGDILKEYEITYDLCNVETEPMPDPTQYAAVIALGGPQHVYSPDQHPSLLQEKQLLYTVIEQDIPYLGICLGSQLLADVLCGQVRPHTMTEIGFYDIEITEEGKKDPLFDGFAETQKVFHWHEDTFDLPKGAILLATNSNTENQAFRYGRCAYGLQYHIEISPDILDLWLYHPSLKENIIATLGIDAYTTIEQERVMQVPIYHKHTRMLMENFLRISHLI